MAEESQQQSRYRNFKSLAVWIALWTAIGLAIGVAFGKPAFALGIGVPIGGAFWLVQNRRRSQ